MDEYTPDSFKILLGKLVKTPKYFTPEDLKLALHHLFTPDAVLPAQIGAFLAALHIGRVEKRPGFLAAAAKVLRARALQAAIEDGDTDFVVDIVGTGGDGHNTFNVSTTAAVVAAGAGARVIKVELFCVCYGNFADEANKHGSKASTSSSGSADLLQSLDCLFTAPSPGTPFPISKVPFTFILAPHYHPALAMIAPYRKSLPFRTLFNVLGPLINPARPRGMVLGVAERELGPTFVQSLHEGGVERALVVCGAEGLDEISCAGDTYAWQLVDGKITETTLHPDLFGLSIHPLASVAGGTPTENAGTFKALLNSGNNIPESLTPVLHFVLLNASALLVVAGLASDFKEGVALAMDSITSGSAWDALLVFRNAGREAVKETNEVEKKESLMR
ncbi:anthranilate phosphoribosyltransferase [Suillus weaverae]|nr:anthranilate phosphoribosyltransferase [Suillus weaverae]